MASIASPGLGSGLDVRGLVDSLVRAEGEPAVNRLNKQEAKLQAQLSALGSVKSALSSFKSALSDLTSISSFQKRGASSSNDDIFSASAAGKPAAGSYEIEVTQLAQVHKLSSESFDEISSPVGTGTLTFQFGDPNKPAQSITIDAGSNSLTGLRDTINAADIGVRASIIKGDDGYQMVFSADKSGESNSLRISVNEGASPGLARFAFGEGVNDGMTEVAAAQDAKLTIDGISVSSATNTVSDAIAGVTLTLKKADAGVKATLDVTEDKSSASEAVEGFVSAYNSLVSTINNLSGYNAETQEAGILIGDSSLRSVMGQIGGLLTRQADGVSGAYQTLVDLGIKTQADGTLSLDKSKLTAALDSNFDDIGRLFAVTAQASDSLVSYVGSSASTKVGSYELNITQAASRGQYVTNASVSSLTVDSSNSTLGISVDGVASGAISLAQKTYASGAELAAELQSRINGDSALKAAGVSVLVSFEDGHFSFTSERYGSASKIAITEVGTNGADIGLSVGSGVNGRDVEGTIGGIKATGSGQYLTGTGALDGLNLLVTGDALGARGNVNFTRGVADQLNSLLDGWLGKDSSLTARTNGVQSQIADITKQREALATRLESIEARYMKQFSALDALMAQMQSTSNWLAGQLASLPGAHSGN